MERERIQPKRIIAENGSIEKWILFGKFHREDGPAWTKYKNGEIVHEEWYIDDLCHRIGGPAHIEYKNGRVIKEVWWVEGKCHREDGPAYIEYDINGKPTREAWYVNNERHRGDGPARIDYKDGVPIKKVWILQSKVLQKEDFTSIKMIDKLKAYSLFSPIEIARLKKNAA